MDGIRRMLAALLALALVMSIPVQALAESYDLDTGSITVTADDSGQYVHQDNYTDTSRTYKDGKGYRETTSTVITQTSPEATGNTVTITGSETANVTLDGVNIQGVETPAVTIEGSANLTLAGENQAAGGLNSAGVRVEGEASLVISQDSTGSLEARGNISSAGIGASGCGTGIAGNITINGGEINAQGGIKGAGIGGGKGEDGTGGGSITINGGDVTAKGGKYAAGIGGSIFEGVFDDGNQIAINGGVVTAEGGTGAAGIGAGPGGDGGNIAITGGSVTAAAGGEDESFGSGEAIGGGFEGSTGTVTITGGTVNGTCYDPPKPAAQTQAVSEPQEEASGEQDSFWNTVHWKLTLEEAGSTYTVQAGSRTWMPRFVIERAQDMGITLIIQWDLGEDITITPTEEIDLSRWRIELSGLLK